MLQVMAEGIERCGSRLNPSGTIDQVEFINRGDRVA